VAIPCLEEPANYARFSVCCLNPGVAKTPAYTLVSYDMYPKPKVKKLIKTMAEMLFAVQRQKIRVILALILLAYYHNS
jgi:hypothetical protein